jgi:putative restriction endonuclease
MTTSSTLPTSWSTPTSYSASRSSPTASPSPRSTTPAFDNHLIGIDPDGRVHVSERLLMLHDGPLLEQSLKACAGALIRPARGKHFGPDRDRLAARFEQFRRAA